MPGRRFLHAGERAARSDETKPRRTVESALLTSPDPLSDPIRLAAVAELDLVDAPQQELLARLNRLAQQLLGVPVSIVSIIDRDRQVHASQRGLQADEISHSEFDLDHSFCANIVRSGEPLIVEDARQHPVVKDNLSVRDHDVIAYAGLPLQMSSGEIVGAFCAIDSAPRSWTESELETVRDLTELATALLEQRRQAGRE